MSERVVFRIRASSMPAAFTCPGSARPVQEGGVLVDPVSDAGDGGSAGHAVMAALVDADATTLYEVDLEPIARRWSVDVDDLKITAFIGLKVWKSVREWLRPAQSEVYLEASFEIAPGVVLELSGHIDALAVARLMAAHGDWKFGRMDRDYQHQVHAYSALVLGNYPSVEKVDGFVGWMRSGQTERVERMTRENLWQWLDEVRERVVQWDGVYHPGGHCSICPRAAACPALATTARRDVLVFGGEAMAAKVEAGLGDLSDSEVVSIWRRWKSVERLGKSLHEAVQKRVRAAGGALPDGDGRELRFIDSPRRVVSPKLGLPVLREHLTEDEILGCMKIGMSAVDDAVAAKTPKGGKKKAIEAVAEALEAAGAVTTETNEKLMDLRVKE